jgi:RNA polymerase sigma-70 factor, ECF subfamily
MPVSPEEDRLLLKRAQSGDEAAVDVLARSWRAYILTICRSEVPDHEEAADLSQRALIRFVSRLHLADPARPLAPWVATLARNVCRSAGRKLAREPGTLSLSPAGPDEDRSGVADPPAGARSDPEMSAAAQSVRGHLAECLDRLTPRSRLLLELRYLAEVPWERLGDYWPDRLPLWGSRASLFSWLKAAREALRRCLEARDVDARTAQDFLDWTRDQA